MTRGERDYTQRVLATVRPRGIVGGRMIFIEDFESLIDHRADEASATFAITTAQETVWEGDAAGQLSVTAGSEGSYFLQSVHPTPDLLSLEMMFKPGSDNLGFAALAFALNDGHYYHYPNCSLSRSGTTITLRVDNELGVSTAIATIPGTYITSYWHLLYMRFNLLTGKYEKVQVDDTIVMMTSQSYTKTTSADPAKSYIQIALGAIPSYTASMYFDNVVLAYEDL